GIPSARKTMLMTTTINYLTEVVCQKSDICVICIYFNFGRNDEQNVIALLAGVLKQLSQGKRSLPDVVETLYRRWEETHSRPSFVEMPSAIYSAAGFCSRVFIIIDALDECQPFNRCRRRFLQHIFDLQVRARANIFATSRFIPEITGKFEGRLCSEIRASGNDVQ
ncbi:hypothetical protein EDB80DRAFT_816068, partial [Ilyonectria destructans]